MADTKKEHYVPRCYLENFENNDKRIHVFDKISLQSRCQRKEEIAHENYFYDVDFEKMMSGETPDKQDKIKKDLKEITGIDDWEIIVSTILNPKHVEKEFLCNVEGIYGPFLKQIINKSYNGNQWVVENCAPFSEEEKLILSLFMAIQIIRTKVFRDTLTQTYEKSLQTLLYKQQMEDDNALPKECFKVNSNKDFIKLQHLGMILDEELALHMAETLSNHIWVMYVNKTDTPFYTSDNPIITIPHKRDKYMSYGGFASDGVEVVFPISPNLLIAMYEKNWHSSFYQDRSFKIINHTQIVDYYNQNQIAHCFRCVFSQKDEFDLAKEICNKYPELRNPDNRIIVG